MTATKKPLLALTASDIMTRDLLLIPEDIPLRSAAHLLLRHQVSGAPVVDGHGKFVGVISSTDFVRLADKPEGGAEERGIFCPFQTKSVRVDGEERALCDLPAGSCLVQGRIRDAVGNEQVICSEPKSVLADWQVVLVECLPTDVVRNFMTADTVTALPATPIAKLARKMVNAQVHRVFIVDSERTLLGVVTSTDILAAVAKATALIESRQPED